MGVKSRQAGTEEAVTPTVRAADEVFNFLLFCIF